jgi:hypothetical protein
LFQTEYALAKKMLRQPSQNLCFKQKMRHMKQYPILISFPKLLFQTKSAPHETISSTNILRKSLFQTEDVSHETISFTNILRETVVPNKKCVVNKYLSIISFAKPLFQTEDALSKRMFRQPSQNNIRRETFVSNRRCVA